ncbi:MAG TPA: hypothetical protein VFX61_11200 [Micromonosporaceae bacterium]|nr:hypothetical protein [Micromonosporaceae bacterium]
MAESSDLIWTALPEEVRDRIDELICRRKKALATKHLWRDAGLDPSPSLQTAIDVVEERSYQLTLQGRVDPEPPPVPASQLIEEARAITDPVVAIEAMWDGDTYRWGVLLLAIVQRPSSRHPLFDEHYLAFLDGRGAPPFTGTGPRMPAAAEAVQKGSAVVQSLGVPFHFVDPDAADIDPPRWWDS